MSAKAMNMRDKVQDLQAKLSRAAKQSLDRRFGALYDKIYREDVLWAAWKRVRANKGKPGIDEESIEYIEQEVGVERFLKGLQEALRKQRYRPLPVRRCWIEKPGKPEKRPLGIPVIRDRVVQAATKIVIEPIFEANFLECSHGYRPKRKQSDAIRAINKAITFKRQYIVIDADIKGCYDNIVQDKLMKLVERRISDPRVLKLIRGWLRAGVMEEGEYQEPDGLGTPQGGVISPLLANIYLHSFDKMFEQSGIPGTLVRFADDLVILLWSNGKKVLEQVQGMMKRLNLEVSREKTRLSHAKDGFDFLGFHLRLCRDRGSNARMKHSCKLWPSDRSMKRIRQKVRETIGRKYSKSLEEMIGELNPVIRGWNNYQRAVYTELGKFTKLNGFVWERLRIFLKRKYGDQSRGTRRASGQVYARLGLCQFG